MGVKPGSVGDTIAVVKGQSQGSRTGGGRGVEGESRTMSTTYSVCGTSDRVAHSGDLISSLTILPHIDEPRLPPNNRHHFSSCAILVTMATMFASRLHQLSTM